MSGDDFEFRTMPDALSAIERQLQERVEPRATAQRRPRRIASFRGSLANAGAIAAWPRPAVALALGLAFALAVALLPGSLSRDSGTAYGQPALLQVEPVPVDLTGPSGKLTAARSFTALGKRAQLLSGSGDWCLSLPHRNPGELRDERAVACVRGEIFFKYGVTLRIGRTFVAVLPSDVRNPVVKHADGRKTTLRPNRLGVVAVLRLKAGEVVTLFGTNGRPRTAAHVPAAG